MSNVEDSTFLQDPPTLRDEWEDDRALRHYLRRVLPPDVLAEVTPSLAELGHLAATDLYDLHLRMDRRENEPRLVQFDAWGRRVDRIETAPEWGRIGAYAAEHGVVAAGYEPGFGEHARLHQFALAYLFVPSSGLYGCPLAMTDGAAKTLLVHGDQQVIDRAVPRLTSRDPARAWTSGQWMTERTGGSDVGISETVAVKDGELWRLHGVKWFTSAITADVALTLARPEGNPAGGRGLAMFYVEVRGGEPDGALNGIRVLRLKDKLGTRQMPTAELALDGTAAHLVGGPADGTRNIAPMLHVTRLWNAVTAAAGNRRVLSLATDYARKRVAFGLPLVEQPLHQATLAQLRVEAESSLQLAMRAVELLGRDEAGVATDRERAVLRLLLPIAKLITGKQAVWAASEGLEAFGGAGYIEDTHLPVLLRDAQVLPIWEGTTNVLSLDVLRALSRGAGAGGGAAADRGGRDESGLTPFVEEVRAQAQQATSAELAAVGRGAVEAAEHAAAWVQEATAAGAEALQHGARRLAFTLGRALQAALLAAQGQHDLDELDDGRTAVVARRFAAEGIDQLLPVGAFASEDPELL